MSKGKITCKNVFKNTEKENLKDEFNKKWTQLINECEKEKLTTFQK